MKNNKSKGVKATSTRNLLSFLMFIVVLGSVAGFYFGLQTIKTYALDVSHTVSDANASGKNIEELGALKQALAEREALVAKANSLFATPNTYQSQVLKDLQKYAAAAGVTITNTEFDKQATGDNTTTPVVTPANSHSVIVTIGSPASYAKLIAFLDALEGNVPKLQVTGVSLSRPSAPSGDLVATEKITITVATR